MLEDGGDARGHPTGAVRPSTSPLLPKSPCRSSTNYPPAAAAAVAAARPPIDSSSSFGRLSAVRTNLYELCLAILLGGHNWSASADSETAFNMGEVHEVGLEGGSTAGPDQFDGGVCVTGSGGDGSAARARTPLREGAEWAVKEFRRVGKSMKPVHVFCQVRGTYVFFHRMLLGNYLGDGLCNRLWNGPGNGLGNGLGNALGNDLDSGLDSGLGNGLGSGLRNGLGKDLLDGDETVRECNTAVQFQTDNSGEGFDGNRFAAVNGILHFFP